MKSRPSTIIQLLLVVMLLALSVNGAAGSYPQLAAAPYKLIFIDVGQGDAALLIDPHGFTVLIDGGDGSAGPVLTSYIRELGIAYIDVMVATHPDSDHIGGLIAVLQMTDVPVMSVVYNGYPGSTQTWTDFEVAVWAEGLTLTPAAYPDSFAWGTIRAVTLNPAAGLSNPDSNAACLAFLVHTGNIKTLFACDLDSAQESEILDRIGTIDVDLLKVAHHGSGDGSSTAFLTAVSPTEAIISVGDNSYGHPHPATIDRLEDAGARIWRTDLQGTITVLTDEVSYAITYKRKVFLPLVRSVETAAPAPQVIISTIFHNGAGSTEPDEYVEIFNSGGPVQLQGWTLRDNQSHIYTFFNFQMQANQFCRIYTNQNNTESCGFNFGSSSAIWNNTGDCASLINSQGLEVHKKCYP